MAQRVYVVMDGKGKPLGFGTKIEAIAAAEKHASAKGGVAVLQEPDPRDPEKVENPPPPPEAAPTDAYRFTGLPEICQQKYGQEYLDINLVESITLEEALRLCRPHLPQAEKYGSINDKLLGGQGAGKGGRGCACTAVRWFGLWTQVGSQSIKWCQLTAGSRQWRTLNWSRRGSR